MKRSEKLIKERSELRKAKPDVRESHSQKVLPRNHPSNHLTTAGKKKVAYTM